MILLAGSEGPGQTARPRSLIWAFCPKTYFRVARPVWRNSETLWYGSLRTVPYMDLHCLLFFFPACNVERAYFTGGIWIYAIISIITPSSMLITFNWSLFNRSRYNERRGGRNILFLFLHENIYYGYLLEAPSWGASKEYPQLIFSWRSKKNINNFR